MKSFSEVRDRFEISPQGVKSLPEVIALLFFLAVNLGMLLFYAFVTYKIFLYTDSATKSLLANEILTRGELLPKGWCYVNNDVWVFFHHIFLIPLIKLFGLNYFSYALNCLVFYLLYWVSIWYYLRSLTLSVPTKLLIAILAVSSLSFCYAMYLFGEIAYISSFIFIFLFLGTVQRLIDARGDNLARYNLAVFVLVFAFGIHNPQRALIYTLLPVLFVSFYLYFIKNDSKKRYLVFSLVAGVSFVLATIFYYAVITKDITMIRGANNLLFANFDGVASHLRIFFLGLLDTLNLVTNEEFSPFTLGGVRRLASFLFSALIAWSLYKTAKALDRINNECLIVFLLFVYYLAVNLFLYLFTRPLAQDLPTFRYFYPVVMCSFLVTAFFLENVRWNTLMKKVVPIVVVLFLSVSNFTQYVKPAFSGGENPHENLGRYLTENNLTYGFATYWHSYVTTVLAENDALVAPVYFTGFVPMHWLSDKEWYNGRGTEKTFIIFTTAEFKEHYDSVIARIGRKPHHIDDVDDFKIAVFETKGEVSLFETKGDSSLL